jgi:hypothetical protein
VSSKYLKTKNRNWRGVWWERWNWVGQSVWWEAVHQWMDAIKTNQVPARLPIKSMVKCRPGLQSKGRWALSRILHWWQRRKGQAEVHRARPSVLEQE